MKILLFGATGMIGQRIAAELAGRGHEVTGLSRTGPVKGDVHDTATLAKGHDAVISAIAPPRDGTEPGPPFLAANRALIEGARSAGVRRLIVVGGAGSLQVSPGVDLVDTPGFPDGYKKESLAARDVLRLYREVTDLDWTFVSPAAEIGPGERTGAFRVGGDMLLTDDQGRSAISAEDFAVAIADEVEQNAHPRSRITAAY
ncbi:NAD-dependent epimerase/dehydratase family protein [Nonomuraea sp. KC401]|uniref:NAD(P)-dependent oxidoreductase n=1 Tax=unclassified Nonomuraea TaxID=2593643 RepID=UPI0010FF588E|nr:MULTISPECIES: NAD(P)H-binding protein [unclassified Nonomuraea]NBE96820.1 NAD(P)H-binding protein [Nonomuraea sp. K271]TLF68021.1 NAD-dependent epimerase/dehydratase family protein [Nonomuraea sp. KC401]